MNINEKVLNKIWAKHIQQYIKRISLDKVGFYPRDAKMVQYLQINLAIPCYQTEEKKSHHLNKCRKSFWQNSNSTYHKTYQQSKYRRNITQHNKAHYDKYIILNREKLKALPVRLGTRQDDCSQHIPVWFLWLGLPILTE